MGFCVTPYQDTTRIEVFGDKADPTQCLSGYFIMSTSEYQNLLNTSNASNAVQTLSILPPITESEAYTLGGSVAAYLSLCFALGILVRMFFERPSRH